MNGVVAPASAGYFCTFAVLRKSNVRNHRDSGCVWSHCRGLLDGTRHLKVLLQPAELLIIGGAGAGTVLIANPLHILKQIASGVVVVFNGSSLTKQRYIESLKLGYELLNKARRPMWKSLTRVRSFPKIPSS
jgi:Motility protein A N-terminal